MPKYVYQLIAKGYGVNFNAEIQEFTSTIFTTKEKAEKRIEAFKKILSDDSRLYCMQEDTIKITIKKLEIIE